MSRWQFTIRDWLWLSIVVGLVIGWRLHYESLSAIVREAEDKNGLLKQNRRYQEDNEALRADNYRLHRELKHPRFGASQK